MVTTQHTLFISDLHLDPETPEITEYFRHFLTEYAPHADALYILGDLFEVWLGDDHHTEFTHTIKDLIKKATQKGLPVFIMRGNRDFLLDKRFERETGCTLIQDPLKIQLYHHKVILTHGDALCAYDKQHQQYRKIIQHPITKALLQILPLSIRKKIGQKLRSKSQQHLKYQQTEVMDAHPKAVIDLLMKSHCQFMIHGHTHQAAIHPLEINNHPAERIVLSSWHHQGHALKWYADGEKELLTF